MAEEQPIAPAVSAGAPKKSKLWLIIIIAVLVLGGGGYFAYAKISGGSLKIPGLSSSKFNSNCKYNDPDLCKFINNWKEVKNLTMTSTDTTGGKTTTAVFKMEGEDNSQIILSEGGKETYNTVILGKTTYTKDYTDNKWFKYTPTATNTNISSEESRIDFDTKADSAEDKTTYKKIGKEACGSLTCFKYQVIDPAITDSTEYIYFDSKEYLLRKTRSEANNGNISEATYDYTKFTLPEPSPTKEGDPLSGLTESATTTGVSGSNSTSTSTSTSSSSATDNVDYSGDEGIGPDDNAVPIDAPAE